MRRSRRQRFRMKQRDEDIREPPNGDSPARRFLLKGREQGIGRTKRGRGGESRSRHGDCGLWAGRPILSRMGRSRNRESSAERPDPNQQRSSTRPLTLRMEARSSTRRKARGPGRIRQTDERLPTTALDKRPTSHGSPERKRRVREPTSLVGRDKHSCLS